MYRIGLFAAAVLLVLSTACGRIGTNKTQSTDQGNSQNGAPGRGNFGGGQGRFSPEDMAKRQIEGMGEFIKLTEEQKAKITEISLNYAKKTSEMRSGRSFRDMSDEERQEMRSKMETIQAEREKEIKAVLTEGQLGDYDAYKKEMDRRRQEMMQQRQQQN